MAFVKKKHIITEEEALAVADALFEELLPDRLLQSVDYISNKIQSLGLSEAQANNLIVAYDSIADAEPDLQKRVNQMSVYFDGDKTAALALCTIENMRVGAQAIALSAAEDINTRNQSIVPFRHMRRKAEKKDALGNIREALVDSLVGYADVGEHEAELCLQSFETSLSKKLKELAGHGRGVGG